MFSNKSHFLVVAIFVALISSIQANILTITSPVQGAVVTTGSDLMIQYTVSTADPVTLYFDSIPIQTGFIPLFSSESVLLNAITIPVPCCLKSGRHFITLGQDGVIFTPPVEIRIIKVRGSECDSSSSD